MVLLLGKKPQQRGEYLSDALDANHLKRYCHCATAKFSLKPETDPGSFPITKAPVKYTASLPRNHKAQPQEAH
jgi:hypothetical protein